MVTSGFGAEDIQPQYAYLEPSFYSDQYGLQGRLDIFHYDPEGDHGKDHRDKFNDDDGKGNNVFFVDKIKGKQVEYPKQNAPCKDHQKDSDGVFGGCVADDARIGFGNDKTQRPNREHRCENEGPLPHFHFGNMKVKTEQVSHNYRK